MKAIISFFKNLLRIIFGNQQPAPPSYTRPFFSSLYKPKSSISETDRKLLKREILSTKDWYNPILLDGDMVVLKADWMKDFHYYRHKHIFSNLLKRMSSLKNQKVLDIGCNEGYYSFAASDLGAAFVKGVDLREINISRANQIKKYYGYENCEFDIGNISDLAFSDIGKFDVVFCFGVIYHLENPMLAIRNLRAVTGSWLIMDSALISFTPKPIVRIDIEPTENKRAGETGVAFYPSLGALITMLKCGGFRVEVVNNTEPAFWSSHCGHDYRRNQATLICS